MSCHFSFAAQKTDQVKTKQTKAKKIEKKAIQNKIIKKEPVEISVFSIIEQEGQISIVLHRKSEYLIDKISANRINLNVKIGKNQHVWRLKQIDPQLKKINKKQGKLTFKTKIPLKKPTRIMAQLTGGKPQKEFVVMLRPKTKSAKKSRAQASNEIVSSSFIGSGKNTKSTTLQSDPVSIDFDLYVKEMIIKKNRSGTEIEAAVRGKEVFLYYILAKKGYYSRPDTNYKLKTYFASSADQIGPDTLIDEQEKKISSTSEFNGFYLDYKIPEITPIGSYNFYMVMDQTNRIKEADENNNIKTAPIVINPRPVTLKDQDLPKPDLFVENIVISNNTVQTRDWVIIQFDIVNQGNAISAPCQFAVSAYYTQPETTYSSQSRTNLISGTIPELGINSRISLNKYIRFPDASAAGDTGFQFLEVLADSDETIPEENENNNQNDLPINISLIEEKPDLLIEAIIYNVRETRQVLERPGGRDRVGREFDVQVKIRNQGNISTDNSFYVTCWFFASTGEYGDIEVDSWTREIGPLDANTTYTITEPLRFAAFPNPSQEAIANLHGYYVGVKVDGGNMTAPPPQRGRVWESNETSNNYTYRQAF